LCLLLQGLWYLHCLHRHCHQLCAVQRHLPAGRLPCKHSAHQGYLRLPHSQCNGHSVVARQPVPHTLCQQCQASLVGCLRLPHSL
jgi:hypothetical protein